MPEAVAEQDVGVGEHDAGPVPPHVVDDVGQLVASLLHVHAVMLNKEDAYVGSKYLRKSEYALV